MENKINSIRFNYEMLQLINQDNLTWLQFLMVFPVCF